MEYQTLSKTNGVKRVVDTDTGEISYLVAESTHSIVSKKKQEAYKRLLAKQKAMESSRSRYTWVACYHESIKNVSKKVSLEGLGAVFLLLPYLNRKDQGKLIFKGEPMNMKTIAATIDKSLSHTNRLVPALVESGVLFKEKDGKKMVYGIHSDYHHIGKAQGGHFTKVYQTFTLKLKQEYDLSIQLAGILYVILPYFHYKTFSLCSNPNEEDERLLHPMGVKELSELLDIPQKTMYRHMNGLAHRGIVMKMSSHGVTMFRVNPDLMYRQEFENDYTKLVREDFKKTMELYQSRNSQHEIIE
ncbi:helix-turn-helix domain-containing protein [Peribacillus frigoritolerans]|uniref:winged helix-turn-helix domain-containing protein n=1 Tax=Peribacillus frigoritolerans TaxID=450367 RepID=UPI00207AE2E2|nr:helix-turn-helix domain-containing protein [Peribacillus frigoritolerans]USK78942.1 helix-turn-helix domain-containing protein [Peribacillus frigoritolerans]